MKATLPFDLLFKSFYRTCNIEPLDAPTMRADEKIIVPPLLDEGVISAAIVQPHAADETKVSKFDEHTIDSGLICSAAEVWRSRNVCKREGLVGAGKDIENVFQCLGASQSCFSSTF